jgi:hypothetical protein
MKTVVYDASLIQQQQITKSTYLIRKLVQLVRNQHSIFLDNLPAYSSVLACNWMASARSRITSPRIEKITWFATVRSWNSAKLYHKQRKLNVSCNAMINNTSIYNGPGSLLHYLFHLPPPLGFIAIGVHHYFDPQRHSILGNYSSQLLGRDVKWQISKIYFFFSNKDIQQ